MHTLKLSYFDFHGGRGEPIRLALSIGGIPFEDHRVGPPDWAAMKGSTPFGAMPVLEVDGRAISQSNSILRFVGKLTDLYPSDPLEALLCDELMAAAEDLSHKLAPTYGMQDAEAQKAARMALAEGPITDYLRQFQVRLEEAGGVWFAGGRLSVADLKLFSSLRHLRSGRLDHVPTDLVDRVAPKLVAHHDRVRQHPGVAKYYAERGVTA